ncbi:invasion associated locus B family protein [Halocynthiibacter namhaensis]|uniref:invasion associated locus B family protein n=1 Tax=Halocynthiibacter namhaensis TaxID=1290553 RepID=UPI0005796D38|nr:invasion associated locus B family protein [Halocynthiibacter namhaensis]
MWKITALLTGALFLAACQQNQPTPSDRPVQHVNTEPEFSSTQSERLPQSWQDAVGPGFRYISRHGYWSVLCKDATKGCWATARVDERSKGHFLRAQVARIFDAPPHHRALAMSFRKSYHTADGVTISTASGVNLNVDYEYCNDERCTARVVFKRADWEDLLRAGEIQLTVSDANGQRHFTTLGTERLEEALGVAEASEKQRYGNSYQGVTLP